MDLDDLEALLAVVDAGSVAAAALVLDLPRSSLRRRLAELEARVGVPLLVASPAGATLTEAGAVLVERGRPLLAAHRALVPGLAGPRPSPRVALRVELSRRVPMALLTDPLSPARLPDGGPPLRVEWAEGPLVESRADVVVGLEGEEGPPGADRLALGLLELRAWASAGWIEAHGAPADLDGLIAQPLLAWDPLGDGGRWPRAAGGELEVRPRLVAADPEIVRRATLAGQGVGLLPTCVADGLRPVVPAIGRRDRLYAWTRPGARATLGWG